MNSDNPSRPRPPLTLLLGAFATVYLVWGSTYFGIRYAVESIPPFLMGGSRFLVAGLILFVWTQRKRLPWPTARQWRDGTILGILMILGGNGGVTWAEKTIPSSVAALIVAVVPLWMVLLEWAEPTGRRPTPRVITGLAIGFSGVAMLVAKGQGYQGEPLRLLGVVAILISNHHLVSGIRLQSTRRQAEGSAGVDRHADDDRWCGHDAGRRGCR